MANHNTAPVPNTAISSLLQSLNQSKFVNNFAYPVHVLSSPATSLSSEESKKQINYKLFKEI